MFEFDIDGLNTQRLERSFLNNGIGLNKAESNVKKLIEENISMIKIKNAKVKFIDYAKSNGININELGIKSAFFMIDNHGVVNMKQIGQIIDSINKEKCFVELDLSEFVKDIEKRDTENLNLGLIEK